MGAIEKKLFSSCDGRLNVVKKGAMVFTTARDPDDVEYCASGDFTAIRDEMINRVRILLDQGLGDGRLVELGRAAKGALRLAMDNATLDMTIILDDGLEARPICGPYPKDELEKMADSIDGAGAE